MKKLVASVGLLVASVVSAFATTPSEWEATIDSMETEVTSFISYALPVIGGLIVAAFAVILVFKAAAWLRRAINRA